MTAALIPNRPDRRSIAHLVPHSTLYLIPRLIHSALMRCVPVTKWACGAVVLCHFAGCGFALKGVTQPLPFSALQLQTQSNSYLASDVSAALQRRGVTLSTDAKAAVPRLALTGETRSRSVLSTNVNGRVREFQLAHSVTVQVWDGQGREWLAPVVYTQTRDLSYDETKVLAKESEEQALYKDMQSELLMTVMRRLEATRNAASPAAEFK
jgi:LPS-assembly lipoprotein